MCHSNHRQYFKPGRERLEGARGQLCRQTEPRTEPSWPLPPLPRACPAVDCLGFAAACSPTATHVLAASHPCALPHPGPFSLQTQFDPTPRRKCLIRDCLAGDLPQGCRARSFSGPGFAPSVRRPRALCGFTRELLVLCPLLSILVAFLQVLAWWARRGDHSTHVCFVRCSSAGRDLLRLPCRRYSPSLAWGERGAPQRPLAKPPLLRGVLCILCSCVYGSKMYNISLLFVADMILYL